MKHQLLWILVIPLFLCAGCENAEGPEGVDPITPSLKVLAPTNLTETEFQLNWSLSTPSGFQSIAVDLSEDQDMNQVSKHLETGEISKERMQVTGLKGATRYYYRISLLDEGIPYLPVTSKAQKPTTGWTM